MLIKKKIEIFVNMGPHGGEISKRYVSYSYSSFSAKLFFLNEPCGSYHRYHRFPDWDFEFRLL